MAFIIFKVKQQCLYKPGQTLKAPGSCGSHNF